MRKENPPAARQNWTSREVFLLGVICLLCGLAVGYVARGPSALATQTAAAASPAPLSETPAGQPAPPSVSPDVMAAPLLERLKGDPKNADLLAQLGNLYSDNHDCRQAIDYYQSALAERPNDVNVRTDMGTCYWYSGQAEKAVAEYRRSLSVDATHPQSLFNLGVVLSNGLNDYAGAIAAWEKLLKAHPDYQGKSQVLSLIEEARNKQSQSPAGLPK